MSASTRLARDFVRPLLAATAITTYPLALGAQEPPNLLADARAQLVDRKLDSAITLLRAVIHDGRADSSERAEAFMWLAVAFFYKGQDSIARRAFRDALQHDPFFAATIPVAKLDSALAGIWEHEQTIGLCGEALPGWGWPPGRGAQAIAMNAEARRADAPEILSGPSIHYPDHLRRARVQGRVLVRVIVDSSGNPELGSARILSSPHKDFNSHVTSYAERARFRAPVSNRARGRSCVIFPVDFRIHR